MRDVPPTLLQQSCEIACLGDIIAKLPSGLDTVIGERGYTFRVANVSGSVSRERSAGTRRSFSWMKQPLPWTRPPNTASWKG